MTFGEWWQAYRASIQDYARVGVEPVAAARAAWSAAAAAERERCGQAVDLAAEFWAGRPAEEVTLVHVEQVAEHLRDLAARVRKA